MDSDPAVVMVLPDTESPVITGAVYLTDDEKTELACDPTVALNFNAFPYPATEEHVICVLADDTLHDVAVNRVPSDPPYVTATVCPLVGPKLVPVTTIDSPPSVASVPVTVTPVMAAAVYDSVADDSADVCDPTVTFHLWLAPTPAADVQVIAV